MRTTPMTHKHRATEPIPVGERPDAHRADRAHRAVRSNDLPVAAILGIILVLIAVYLTVRG